MQTFFLRLDEHISGDAIDIILRRLIKLPALLPGIASVYAGKNYSKQFSEHTHAVIVLATSTAALSTLVAYFTFLHVARETMSSEKRTYNLLIA